MNSYLRRIGGRSLIIFRRPPPMKVPCLATLCCALLVASAAVAENTETAGIETSKPSEVDRLAVVKVLRTLCWLPSDHKASEWAKVQVTPPGGAYHVFVRLAYAAPFSGQPVQEVIDCEIHAGRVFAVARDCRWPNSPEWRAELAILDLLLRAGQYGIRQPRAGREKGE